MEGRAIGHAADLGVDACASCGCAEGGEAEGEDDGGEVLHCWSVDGFGRWLMFAGLV